MKKKFLFIFIILYVNFKAHCQIVNYKFFIDDDQILYKKSKIALQEKKFEKAILILEKIKKNNNFRTDKIYINLIYAYYKNLNFNKAKNNIEQFIKLYPNHFNMDYVVYLKGLIYIDMDKNILFNIPSIFYYKNNPEYAVKAFLQLKNFVYHFPTSQYLINAKKKLIYLKKRLSEYDFNILNFYFSHKKYIAVINRGEEIIQKYPETEAARKALLYIRCSYLKLKIFETANKISKIILLNKI